MKLTRAQGYDFEREIYIKQLEKENERLKKQIAETTSLLMRGEAAREKVMFEAICAGAFTGKRR